MTIYCGSYWQNPEGCTNSTRGHSKGCPACTEIPDPAEGKSFCAESKIQDEEDLLSGIISDVQSQQTVKEKDVKDESFAHEKYKNVDLGDRKVQHERIMETNYEWRNLNPYFVLLLGIGAIEEDTKRR